MSILRHLTLLCSLIAMLSACGAAPTAQAPTVAPITDPTAEPTFVPTAVPTPAARTITDVRGREVSLGTPPARIVSLAPSATEILFAVGAGALVVGNTNFCNFPAQAAALPKIGGVTARTISIEAIVDLTPDLVIAGSASQTPVAEALEALGIPVFMLDPQHFDDVYTNIAQLGAITGRTEQAEAVIGSMQMRIAAVTDVVATIPAEERPTVFWEVFDEPLMTAGPNTFIGQMIDLAGATSIFADVQEDYPQVSAEAIVERDPQVILGPDTHVEKLTPELVAQRPGWDALSAVQNGRVLLLDADIVSRPGPRLADALEALAQALYPERFP